MSLATSCSLLLSVEIIPSARRYLSSRSWRSFSILFRGASFWSRGREVLPDVLLKMVSGEAQRHKTMPLDFKVSIIPWGIGSPPPQEIKLPLGECPVRIKSFSNSRNLSSPWVSKIVRIDSPLVFSISWSESMNWSPIFWADNLPDELFPVPMNPIKYRLGNTPWFSFGFINSRKIEIDKCLRNLEKVGIIFTWIMTLWKSP